MEVDTGGLVEVVGEDRPDCVAFDDGQSWPWPNAVVAECGDRILERVDAMVDPVDGQFEDFGVALDPWLERLVAHR
ncbi:MAG: hypothetical protein H0V36_09095 [Chloroflexi bacterium]|nr:hypothetical protein [Chloroflexota bacterium]